MNTLNSKSSLLKGACVSLYGWTLQIFICTAILLTPFQTLFAHGTVTSPPSRVWVCFQENPESPDSPACADAITGWGTQAFYDWSEVARMDAGGRHQAILADGNLASAGRPDKFGGIDQVRDDWVATSVTPGPYTVTWTNSAPHQTLYYRVYITKADWNPNLPLTWDSLELLVETEPRPANATDNIDVVLPQRIGKHVIFSIWQRSLTPEAFYSTSDVDFGTEALPNEAPVAEFSYDNGRCGGNEVEFDASASTDINGDVLTYSWDFGDGTTAQGETVSHTFADGDEATVMLTVSDDEFSSGTTQTFSIAVDPDCNEIVCPFDTPRESPLPSINETYFNAYVIGEGGPDFSNIYKFFINWDLGNNGLYNFDYQTLSSYTRFVDADQNFNQAAPAVTMSGTGISNFDGTYFVTLDQGNLVLASDTGNFTIYFSNSETGPDCDGENPTEPTEVDGGLLTGGPFEFTVGDGFADNVSGITITGASGDNSQWIVADSTGNILGLPFAIESVNFDGAGVGRCFIYNLSYNGTVGGLTVGGNITSLTGDFDLSNSVDVERIADDGVEVEFEDVIYDEEEDGDLSNDNTAPTGVSLALGNNRVIATQTADNTDYLAITIPEGFELSQLFVDSFASENALDPGFIAIAEGTSIGFTAAELLGGLVYGENNVGDDILADMSTLPGAIGFTTPLSAGTYTLWLNQTGGLSSTTLNFLVTAENEVVDPPTGDCSFGAPLDTPLPSFNNISYEYVHVLGEGGPDMSAVEKFVINWDLNNNGLWQFSFNLNRGPWYINFSDAEQNFDDVSPGIYLTGTGIEGLDGYYYPSEDNGNFVLVAASYTIYFSNDADAPDCGDTAAKSINELASLAVYPNPATTNTLYVSNDVDLQGNSITISDLSGKTLKSLNVAESTTTTSVDIAGLPAGLYLVKVTNAATGFSIVQKLIVR